MGALKVLYIGGTSFSGSTFLGAALSQHPQLFLAGELIGFVRHHPRTHKCSCGRLYHECSFWQETLQTWQRKTSLSLEDYRTLCDRYERIRAYPSLLSPGLPKEAAFRQYAAASRAFLQVLSELSQSSVIVDISKYPTRALALSRAGIDVVFVHLVKNGLAYLDSNTRRLYVRHYEDNPWWPRWRFWVRSALEWDLINLLAMDVSRRLPGLRLRYEDYITDPAAAFARIGQRLEVDDLADYGDRLRRGAEIHFGHALGGNLIRLRGPARLSPNSSWRSRITPTQRAIYCLLAGWLGKRYGYPC